MQSLYPFLLNPEYVERVWGTHDLSPFYDTPVTGAPIGEVWLTGDRCKVSNGALAGKTLAELSKEYGEQLVGSGTSNPKRFPLLLKVLYPKEKLSVQVHPDDDQAKAVGEACGKTECWYVLCSDPGAQVAVGLQPGVAAEQVKAAIHENRLEQLLNWLTVHPGDMLYIAAGTVHAIAPGSILLETQQNSDTTYRLYDYGRPRELHIEKGLAAVNSQACAGKISAVERDGHSNLIESPYFVVSRFAVSDSRQFRTIPEKGNTSAHCIFAVAGSGTLEAPGRAPIELLRGAVALVPASIGEYAIHSSGKLELVCAHLPETVMAHPHARASLYEHTIGTS